MRPYTAVPVFTPANTQSEIVMMPGTTGAANWNGAGFDPETGRLYVPVLRNGVRTMIIENRGGGSSTFAFDRKPEPLLNTNVEIPYLDIQPGRPVKEGDPSRLPVTKPPYGAIVALDMNKGEILWKIANGDGLEDHPVLKPLNLPAMGTQSRASPLVTKTLLFMGEGKNGPGGPSRIPAWGGGKTFRALDKATGETIWQMELPGGTSGAPMTYMANGKQYIVMAVGWTDMAPEIIALALP
jgi:quinoprotein glucose dehydrogenase